MRRVSTDHLLLRLPREEACPRPQPFPAEPDVAGRDARSSWGVSGNIFQVRKWIPRVSPHPSSPSSRGDDPSGMRGRHGVLARCRWVCRSHVASYYDDVIVRVMRTWGCILLSGPQCLCLLSEDNRPSLTLCRALVKVRGQLVADASTRSRSKRAR